MRQHTHTPSQFLALAVVIGLMILAMISQVFSQPLIPLPGSSDGSRNNTTYIDTSYGWSAEYPSDWTTEIEFENDPSTKDRVILRSIRFAAPNGETIYVDVWENPKDKPVDKLYDKYQEDLMSPVAPDLNATNASIAGVPAYLVTDPSTAKFIEKGSTYPSQTAFFNADPYVYRVEYTASVDGSGQTALDTLLQTFTLTSVTRQPVDLSALTPIPTDSLAAVERVNVRIANCGPLTDTTGNPYPCCYNQTGNGGNCTWYARYRRPDFGSRNFGNAKTWFARARQAGFATGRTPQVGAIAVSGNGTYGHVAYVTKILSGGRIKVDNMNCNKNPAKRYLLNQTHNASYYNLGYIYAPSSPPITNTPTPNPTATPISTTPTNTPVPWVSFGTSASSNLFVATDQVRLGICSVNLPNYNLYVTMHRYESYGNYAPREWRYVFAPNGGVITSETKLISESNWTAMSSGEVYTEPGTCPCGGNQIPCILLRNLDGNSDTFPSVYYHTRAALNAAPDPGWSTEGCRDATGYLGLCDKDNR